MAVLDAHFDVEERWRIIAGTVCATIRNVKRALDSDKVYKWDDFFQRTAHHSPTWQTAEELEFAFRDFDRYGRAKQREKQQQQNGKSKH